MGIHVDTKLERVDYIIGVDFDNTLVSYGDNVHREAVQRGLIPPVVGKSKKEIRDRIRQLPDGEIEWQRLQATVYGLKIRRFFDIVQRGKLLF